MINPWVDYLIGFLVAGVIVKLLMLPRPKIRVTIKVKVKRKDDT